MTKPSIHEVFGDLEVRFLINLPKEELSDSNRLFSQLEQALWCFDLVHIHVLFLYNIAFLVETHRFYEDFYADEYDHLPHLKFKDFAKRMFETCPLLKPSQHMYEELLMKFRSHVGQIPTFGAILLTSDMTKCLLGLLFFSFSEIC